MRRLRGARVNAGDKDRVVRVKVPVRSSDEGGGQESKYEDIAFTNGVPGVFAKIREAKGYEDVRAGQMSSTVTHVIEMWQYPELFPAKALIFFEDGVRPTRTFAIVSIADPDEQGIEWHIRAIEQKGVK